MNTPYRDRMFKLILEIAERGVDVIFLDGPAYYPGACYCKHCRSMVSRFQPERIGATPRGGGS